LEERDDLLDPTEARRLLEAYGVRSEAGAAQAARWSHQRYEVAASPCSK
jgi:hypothetical protein